MVNQTRQSGKYPRGYHPNSLKNLAIGRARQKSWQPGQSGNPAGVSLKKYVSDILRQHLKNIDPKTAKSIEILAAAIVRDAIKGSKEDREEIWERLEGKVAQVISGGNEGDKPIRIEVVSPKARELTQRLINGE